MKKQSLFSKAIQAQKQSSFTAEVNQSFPVAIKLSKEELESQVEIQTEIPLVTPTDMQKAEFHALSEQEYSKINEENLKLLQSMDQNKIQEMQQQIREQLGSGLADMFRSGNIYKNTQKELLGKSQKQDDVQDEQIEQVTQIFQQDVDENLKLNYQALQSHFKDYMQQNDLNGYQIGNLTFSLAFQYQNFQKSSINLDELFTLYRNIQSKGDLQEFMEILDVVLDNLKLQFQLNEKDFIKQNDQIKYRVEICGFFEKNLKLSKFFLDNLSQLFTDLKQSIIYSMERWFSILVYDPWIYSYSNYSVNSQTSQEMELQVKRESQLQDKLVPYQDLLKLNNTSLTLQNILKNVQFSDKNGEKQSFHGKLLDLVRVFQILSDEFETSGIVNLFSTSFDKPEINFIEMVQLLTFYQGERMDQIISKVSAKSIIINFNSPLSYKMIYWFGKMLEKSPEQFSSLTNLVVQKISLYLKNQQFNSTLSQSVKILFLLYDKIFTQNLSQLFKINVTQKQIYPYQYFGEQFFQQQQEDQLKFVCIYFQQILQDLEYQQLETQQPQQELVYLSKILLNLKFSSIGVVSRATRKLQKLFIFYQIRQMFADFLLRLTKIRLNQNSSAHLDYIHVFTQINCRLLGISFYKSNKIEEVSFEVDAPLQGYLNILFVKQMILLNNNQNQALQYVETFFTEIESYREYVHPEILFIRYMKFLALDENLYLQIDQEIQIKFLNHIVQLLDWQQIGQILNKNVKYFEKLLQKYTFDSFRQPIFSNLLFLFTHPIFKADIHNLILMEFAATADLININLSIIDQFKNPPSYSLKSQISLEIYKKYVRQIQNYQLNNNIIKQWVDIVLNSW